MVELGVGTGTSYWLLWSWVKWWWYVNEDCKFIIFTTPAHECSSGMVLDGEVKCSDSRFNSHFCHPSKKSHILMLFVIIFVIWKVCHPWLPWKLKTLPFNEKNHDKTNKKNNKDRLPIISINFSHYYGMEVFLY